ncbi:hypothetical protein BS78_05G252500 [Paspalum vaginatum]|nr:hypothetical protein BS78_05G252500 [Paspalum vaginatum]KAJ1276908.1 hypothetical protein BS78_05G252500 [Paspalum vaginatum]
MADPVATVEKIVKLGLAIKNAVDTVRHNDVECNEIRRRVLRFSANLSQLQQTGMMNDSPTLSGALEDLEETLQHALELVEACQERSTIRRLVKAGELSKQLRRVKDDILNKVMLASFAINAHTTIILLTVQAGGQNPLPQQPEDAGVADISRNIHSSDLRKFSFSDLKAAINVRERIGEGASCMVYKGVLNDENVVAIKIFKTSHKLGWACTYDQLLLASKLQHKNIVKVLGYGHESGESSSMIRRLLRHKIDRAKEREEYFWVEEYITNRSLDMFTRKSNLDWPSLYRIIEGVAQGIHYLHEQRVVHMDLKPGNIVLDSDMNPKIIDFELSKVLNDNEIIDDCIEGTYGFIAPEYVANGIVSLKKDVYAFGLILLESVRGICRSQPPRHYHPIQWAWEAWEAGRIEECFDPSLFDGSHHLMEIKRCVVVGLLCAQDDRADRPTMTDVLEMLNGREELPPPKKSAYLC